MTFRRAPQAALGVALIWIIASTTAVAAPRVVLMEEATNYG